MSAFDETSSSSTKRGSIQFREISEINKRLSENMSRMKTNSIKLLSIGLLGGRNSIVSSARPEDTNAFVPETIDPTPLKDSDALFEDCHDFLRHAAETLDIAHKDRTQPGPLLKLTSNIAKWRVKGQGNKLHEQCDALLPRLEVGESALKSMTDRSMSDCASLMLQASHLRARLTACVHHNENAIQSFKPVVGATQSLFDSLNNYRQSVRLMIGFLDAVQQQKESQVEPYIPWALRAVVQTTQNKPVKIKREKLLLREKNLSLFIDTIALQMKNQNGVILMHQNALQNCSKTLLAMENLLLKLHAYRTIASEEHRLSRPVMVRQGAVNRENPIQARRTQSEAEHEGTTKNTDFVNEKEENEEYLRSDDDDRLPPAEYFDHARCDDCLFVHSMGTECVVHLAAMQHFAEESTKRLQTLFGLRERVKDVSKELSKIE